MPRHPSENAAYLADETGDATFEVLRLCPLQESSAVVVRWVAAERLTYMIHRHAMELIVEQKLHGSHALVEATLDALDVTMIEDIDGRRPVGWRHPW